MVTRTRKRCYLLFPLIWARPVKSPHRLYIRISLSLTHPSRAASLPRTITCCGRCDGRTEGPSIHPSCMWLCQIVSGLPVSAHKGGWMLRFLVVKSAQCCIKMWNCTCAYAIRIAQIVQGARCSAINGAK